jgi:dihydrodipicolinate reductase
MHLVGFDAPGETIELRLTARDRSAYAAGALAAAAWLSAAPRQAGSHPFDAVVDDLTRPAVAATA